MAAAVNTIASAPDQSVPPDPGGRDYRGADANRDSPMVRGERNRSSYRSRTIRPAPHREQEDGWAHLYSLSRLRRTNPSLRIREVGIIAVQMLTAIPDGAGRAG